MSHVNIVSASKDKSDEKNYTFMTRNMHFVIIIEKASQ